MSETESNNSLSTADALTSGSEIKGQLSSAADIDYFSLAATAAGTVSIFFDPTLINYQALITGRLETQAGNLDIAFMGNLWNSVFLSSSAVLLSLVLGVPAAYAFARYRFRLGEDIAFTILSFRFAPPLLVLLPLTLYFEDIGLSNTYTGLIWVYQLISLPLILWIVRGYFEDISPDLSLIHI